MQINKQNRHKNINNTQEQTETINVFPNPANTAHTGMHNRKPVLYHLHCHLSDECNISNLVNCDAD